MSYLDDINKRFEYRLDRDQYGYREYWAIMLNSEGRLVGDCEDYALTVLWYMKNKSLLRFVWSLLTKKAKIWYCLAPNGEGHAVLQYRKSFIDNIQKQWCIELESKGYDMKYCFSNFTILKKLRVFLWNLLTKKK